MPSKKSSKMSPFSAYRAERTKAERKNASSFTYNGKRYVKGTWKTGVVVWKRANRTSKKKTSKR